MLHEYTSGIGDRLRQAREAQHISVQGASRRLKIRESYLRALENEDFDALPPGAYTLGFLRNYALFLGLDYNELKQIYQSSHSPQEEISKISPAARSKGPSGFVLTPGKVIAGIIGVFALLLVIYLFNQYKGLTAAPVLKLYSPYEGEVFHQKSIKIIGQTDPDALLTINGEEIDLSSQGEFSQEFVAFKNGIETLEIKAQNRISKKENVVQRTFQVDLPAADMIAVDEEGNVIEDDGDAGSTISSSDQLEIKVRVVDRVWFNVIIDGTENSEFILEKGQEKVLRADDTIYMHCGKGYATYIQIDGNPEQLLGDTSIVKKTWEKSDFVTDTGN